MALQITASVLDLYYFNAAFLHLKAVSCKYLSLGILTNKQP